MRLHWHSAEAGRPIRILRRSIRKPDGNAIRRCQIECSGNSWKETLKNLTAYVLGAMAFGSCWGSAQAKVERPPQFVAIAFDNCTELERWKEWTDFTQEMNQDGDHLHLTFFVSGVNFLADENKQAYRGPHRHKPGTSNIDFGGSPEEVSERVAYINGLHNSGNEIGSHTVGHFDGGNDEGGENWSAADWRQEFSSYDDLFTNLATHNGLPGVKFNFKIDEVRGFRAPYLSTNPGLYEILKENRFRYDTSRDGDWNAWPIKQDGMRLFKLADLKLHGSKKPTLSMDYNFFMAQSKAKDDPPNYARYREQMLQTYLDYFRENYTGNRAPIHIGHHFYDYQGGAYRQALKAFARAVCRLPEVRCVSYAQLADYLDEAERNGTLPALSSGEFPHYEQEPKIDVAQAFSRERPFVAVEVAASRRLRASLVGAGKSEFAEGNFSWILNGRKAGEGPTFDAAKLRKNRVQMLTVISLDAQGKEVSRGTRPIRVSGRTTQLPAPEPELKSRALR